MRDKQLRKSVLTWSISAVVVLVLAMILSITLNGQWEEVAEAFGLDAGLPETSQYEMLTYDRHTVTQTEFPVYLEQITEEGLLGSVTVEKEVFGVAVDFDLGGREKTMSVFIVRDMNSRSADGAIDDSFTGIYDSLEQMKQQGYTDCFVLMYKDGLFLLGGRKDGNVGLLPMWERTKGMDYYFSHFLEPMTFEEMEYCRRLWDGLYNIDNRKVEWSNSPCMAFDDPPKEATLFAPTRKVHGGDHVKPTPPDADPRNR